MKTNLAYHMVQGHFQLTLFVHVSVYLCKDTENYPIWYDLATKTAQFAKFANQI